MAEARRIVGVVAVADEALAAVRVRQPAAVEPAFDPEPLKSRGAYASELAEETGD